MSVVEELDSLVDALAPAPAGRESPSAARLRYLARALDRGVPAMVANSGRVRMRVVRVAEQVVPIVINDGDATDCYFTSPEAHYVRYTQVELARLRPAWAARAISAFLAGFGAASRRLGFNRCVSINNWLLPTNPQARLSTSALESLTEHLRRRYPDHALVFRTVEGDLPQVRSQFESCGYRLVLNRPVHWWEPEKWEKMPRGPRRYIRRDRRQFLESGLVFEPYATATNDPARLADLYERLYILKHSRLNAHFTAEYFACAGAGFLDLDLATLDGKVVGFATGFEDGDVSVLSHVGYDTSLDRQRFPIYRGLLAHAILRAVSLGRRLFLSTGAAEFKQNRGALERMEYEAVFDQHLHPGRRVPWRVIAGVGNLAVSVVDTGGM